MPHLIHKYLYSDLLEEADQARIDHILDKIRREGIGRLTGKEKKILRDATERQRNEDKRIGRL